MKQSTDQLVHALAGSLQPVRRLRPPLVRGLTWLLMLAAGGGLAILLLADPALFARRAQDPAFRCETAGALLTGVMAVLSAFNLSIPGRASGWAWAPLLPLLLWMGGSSFQCAQSFQRAAGLGPFPGGSVHCFVFIATASVPIAASLFWMLRRARPLRPMAVAATGALGAAALAAVLLQFFHASTEDLVDALMHLAAVLTVVAIGAASGRTVLDAG